MKIVIDKNLDLTRGDYAGNVSRGIDADIRVVLDDMAKVTHTPIDLFNRYGLDIIEAERPENIGIADRQYLDIRSRILGDEELKKQIDQKFLIALKNNYADFDRLLMQKVTYKLEQNEDINRITKELEGMQSNALFRAISVDKENNIVTTYASREGIWDVDGVLTAKSAELRSAGSIRTDRAYRGVKDPTKLIDAKRANYPLLEETKMLIQSGAIGYSYATREQADGTYKDDSPTVYVTEMHYKDELTDEDIKAHEVKEQVKEAITQETTHIKKTQATKTESKASLLKNEKEIHTKHEITAKMVKQDESILKQKETALQGYADRLFADLEDRHKRESEELKQKMQNALGVDREKAKNTFITSLSNGMTVGEAIENLRAAKHNNILIEIVLEDIKNEMILTKQKDEIIASTAKNLASTAKNLASTTKNLEVESKANKTNHQNYILELNKRKEAEIAIGRLKSLTDKMKNDLTTYKVDNVDLKEEIKNKENELLENENELEKQFSEIENKDKKVVKLTEENETIKDRLQNAKIEFSKIRGTLDAVQIQKEDYKNTIEKKDKEFLELSKKVTMLEVQFEKSELLNADHSTAIKKLKENNQNLTDELQKEREKEVIQIEKIPKKKSKLSQEIANLKEDKSSVGKSEIKEEREGQDRLEQYFPQNENENE